MRVQIMFVLVGLILISFNTRASSQGGKRKINRVSSYKGLKYYFIIEDWYAPTGPVEYEWASLRSK